MSCISKVLGYSLVDLGGRAIMACETGLDLAEEKFESYRICSGLNRREWTSSRMSFLIKYKDDFYGDEDGV